MTLVPLRSSDFRSSNHLKNIYIRMYIYKNTIVYMHTHTHTHLVIILGFAWNVIKTVIKSRLWFLSKVEKRKSNLEFALLSFATLLWKTLSILFKLFKQSIPFWISCKEKVHHMLWTLTLLKRLRSSFYPGSFTNLRISYIPCSVALAFPK